VDEHTVGGSFAPGVIDLERTLMFSDSFESPGHGFGFIEFSVVLILVVVELIVGDNFVKLPIGHFD
jgi:hypothetical protein